ncbi:hypothetical protein WICPIJ_009702 [Wickerhamomyces pijperi]|uniref:Uncharacterized protein n=1 Tax=Wickerhamomyces pijperi TaxID=599730 RepID=A0A9P8PLG3_WICPI|nr:hypothetical protein WICPIJ_009702 [Wickerhamomyces pijperi]
MLSCMNTTSGIEIFVCDNSESFSRDIYPEPLGIYRHWWVVYFHGIDYFLVLVQFKESKHRDCSLNLAVINWSIAIFQRSNQFDFDRIDICKISLRCHPVNIDSFHLGVSIFNVKLSDQVRITLVNEDPTFIKREAGS